MVLEGIEKEWYLPKRQIFAIAAHICGMTPRIPMRVAVTTRQASANGVLVLSRIEPMNGMLRTPPTGSKTSKIWLTFLASESEWSRYLYCGRTVATK
jgi:hypothetical protein